MKSEYERTNCPIFLDAQFSFVFLGFFLSSILLLGSCVPQSAPMPTHSPTPLPTPTPVVNTISGDLLDQVYWLEEYMPLGNSNGYVEPTKEERSSYAEIISSLASGDLAYASTLARGHDYALFRFLDVGDDQKASFLLREGLPISRAWGLYLIREERVNNIVVEAPHPLSDKQTDLIALEIYRVLDARALLIAGAHRDANDGGKADVSHESKSIFQAVHETLLRKTPAFSDTPVVLQIHGFTAKKRSGYPNVILGFGKTATQLEVSVAGELVRALASKGLEAEMCEGNSWPDLCGKKNVQGSSKKDAIFIHIELDEAARSDSSLLLAALLDVFVEQKP